LAPKVLLGTLLVLLTSAGPVRAQPDPLALLPADAAAAVAVRSIGDLRTNGDRLVRDLGLPSSFRPNTGLTFGYFLLGISGCVDEAGPAAIILTAPETAAAAAYAPGLGDVVVVLPFKDRDRLRDRLGFSGQKLSEVTALRVWRQFGRFACVRGKHLFLGNSKEAVVRVSRAQTLAQVLSPAKRQRFAGDDFVLHVGPEAWKRACAALTAALATKSALGDPDGEAETLRQLVESVRDARAVVGGVRTEEGLAVHLSLLSSTSGRRLFEAVGGNKKPSSLQGLPDGTVLLAHAGGGQGADSLVLVRPLVRKLLTYFGNAKVLAPADHPLYQDFLTHIWGQVKSNRAALYQLAGPGLFDPDQLSLIAILETENAPRFLQDLRELAAIADHPGLEQVPPGKAGRVDIAALVKYLESHNYRVREVAILKLRLVGEPALSHLKKVMDNPPSLEASRRAEKLWTEISTAVAARRKELLADDRPRLRPRLTFVPRAEPLARHSVDVVRIDLGARDEQTARVLASGLGPEWDHLRLAVHENQVVVLLGSRVDLLQQTLENLSSGKPGLAAVRPVKEWRQRSKGSYKQELHFSLNPLLETLVPLRRDEAEGPRRARSLISAGLAVEASNLHVDMWIPNEEVGAVGQRVRLLLGVLLSGNR
jgi:hypothetical protein